MGDVYDTTNLSRTRNAGRPSGSPRIHSQPPSIEREEDETFAPSTRALNNPNNTVEFFQIEPRKCWICQQEEENPANPPDFPFWRKPCPCSLDAHEECLLEWIADEERPRPGELGHTRKIECPQCKTEIRIERPRDFIVGVYDRISGFARTFVVPFAVSAVAGCVYSGLYVYGLNTITVVFGDVKGLQIIEGAIIDQSRTKLSEKVLQWFLRLKGIIIGTDPFFPGNVQSWKLFLGLPMIGPALILSRTRMADFTLPLIVPMFFLKPSDRQLLDWPPTPGLAFATLPYLRTAYSELYRHTFADLEKKWDLAAQRTPREGETAEEIARNNEAGEGNAIFELEFIEEEVDDFDNPQQRAANLAAAHERRAPMQNGAAEWPEGEQVEGAAPNRRPGRNRHVHRDWQRNFDITQIMTTVAGALAFPAISSVAGDLLGMTLPAKLVGSNINVRFGPKGLLKEKWGRTIIGGCLFVVLKDVVTLYCKWKKARDFGKRKILDYDFDKPGGGK